MQHASTGELLDLKDQEEPEPPHSPSTPTLSKRTLSGTLLTQRSDSGDWHRGLWRERGCAVACMPLEGKGRGALEGKAPQGRPQKRLEEVAKAVGGGYCRL